MRSEAQILPMQNCCFTDFRICRLIARTTQGNAFFLMMTTTIESPRNDIWLLLQMMSISPLQRVDVQTDNDILLMPKNVKLGTKNYYSQSYPF